MNLILATKTFYLIKSRRTAFPCDPDQGDDDHHCVYHNREIIIKDINLASCLNYNRHLHSEIDYSASSIHENDTLTCCRGQNLDCDEDPEHAWKKHALFTAEVGEDNLSVKLKSNSPLFGDVYENVYTCECDFADATRIPLHHKVMVHDYTYSYIT